jgi:hypothetical protein
MWRQRARIQWLAEGDRNTRFFHQKASRRRSKNAITRLARQDGTVTEDVEELKSMTTTFYQNLYSSEGTIGIEEV